MCFIDGVGTPDKHDLRTLCCGLYMTILNTPLVVTAYIGIIVVTGNEPSILSHHQIEMWVGLPFTMRPSAKADTHISDLNCSGMFFYDRMILLVESMNVSDEFH